MIDNRKPLVIAKIAFKLKEFYETNLEQLNEHIAELIPVSKYKVFFNVKKFLVLLTNVVFMEKRSNRNN